MKKTNAPGKITAVLTNLLVAALATGIALLAAECILRFYLKKQYKKQIRYYSEPLFKFDPCSKTGFTFMPNIEQRREIDGARKTHWSFKINSDGYRGEEIARAKKGDEKRVMLLGDSYTFGWAVNGDEVYAQQLKLILDKRMKGVAPVKFVNLGVCGYDTVHEYGVLIEKTDLYRPDIVILQYGMNDAEVPYEIPINPEYTYKYASSWLIEYLKVSVNNKLFPEKPLFKLKALVPSSDYLAGFDPYSPKWREVKDALSAIASFCKSRDLYLLVVIFPDFTQKFDVTYRYEKIHSQVAQWCGEFGVDCIDLFPYFFGREHKKLWVEGDGHPNALAHKEAAEILSTHIEKILLRHEG